MYNMKNPLFTIDRHGNTIMITVNRKFNKFKDKITREVKFKKEPEGEWRARSEKHKKKLEFTAKQLEMIDKVYDENFINISKCKKKSSEHKMLLMLEDIINDRGIELRKILKIDP